MRCYRYHVVYLLGDWSLDVDMRHKRPDWLSVGAEAVCALSIAVMLYILI